MARSLLFNMLKRGSQTMTGSGRKRGSSNHTHAATCVVWRKKCRECRGKNSAFVEEQLDGTKHNSAEWIYNEQTTLKLSQQAFIVLQHVCWLIYVHVYSLTATAQKIITNIKSLASSLVVIFYAFLIFYVFWVIKHFYYFVV